MPGVHFKVRAYDDFPEYSHEHALNADDHEEGGEHGERRFDERWSASESPEERADDRHESKEHGPEANPPEEVHRAGEGMEEEIQEEEIEEHFPHSSKTILGCSARSRSVIRFDLRDSGAMHGRIGCEEPVHVPVE